MIKVIIVDDEEKSRNALRNMLAKHCPDVNVAALCESVDAAVASIRSEKPDLVFLDVEMPHNNGFVLFDRITNPSFKVIFTTAYDQYAIQAIKFSALDYLLKPIDVDELKGAVLRFTQTAFQSKQQDVDLRLLMSTLNLKNKAAKIAVPTFDGLQMVMVEEIVKCTADESYTHITLLNGTKLVVSRILKEFEDLLSEYNFLRIHNSSLINLAHVKKYVKGEGGYVVMVNDESVEVSRRKKGELLQKLSLVQL
jgi:two-component system LytT family response regulator